MKKYMTLALVGFFGISFGYILSSQQEEYIVYEDQPSSPEKSLNSPSSEPLDRSVASQKKNSMNEKNKMAKKENNINKDKEGNSREQAPQREGYIGDLLKDPRASHLHQEILEKFPQLEEREALADWVALGLQLDSSTEFAQAYRETNKKLNEKPHEILNAISQGYNDFKRSDSFLRSMLINVVNQLNVSPEEKINFYSQRFNDKIILDKEGNFDLDSMNITNSMAFIKNYTDDTAPFESKIIESLEKHADQKEVQKQLAERFEAYFPNLKNKINEIITR